MYLSVDTRTCIDGMPEPEELFMGLGSSTPEGVNKHGQLTITGHLRFSIEYRPKFPQKDGGSLSAPHEE